MIPVAFLALLRPPHFLFIEQDVGVDFLLFPVFLLLGNESISRTF